MIGSEPAVMMLAPKPFEQKKLLEPVLTFRECGGGIDVAAMVNVVHRACG